MKKVLAITCILVLVLLVSSVAMAAENNWRFKLTADDGSGNSGSINYFGMLSAANDGAESQDASYPFLAPPGSANAALVGNAIGTDGKFYNKDIRGAFGPVGTPLPTAGKVWDWKVGALPDAGYNNIRIQFFTLNSTTMMPASYGGVAAVYTLKMINNQGVAGAPANGTVWTIPAPTAHSSTVPYFTLTLPKINAEANSAAAMLAADGVYQMEFKIGGVEEPPITPEPSSLLALGTGLIGMLGFVARRRRA